MTQKKKKLAQQMKQLPQDYKDGKITMDELTAKMQEYNDRIKYINEHMNPVKVDPGNKCIITKSMLNVETIESGDEKWWEKIE